MYTFIFFSTSDDVLPPRRRLDVLPQQRHAPAERAHVGIRRGALIAAADGGMYRVESLGLLPPARVEDASSVRDDGAEIVRSGETGAGAHGATTERELDLLAAQLAGPSPATVVLRGAGAEQAGPARSSLAVRAVRAIVVTAAADAGRRRQRRVLVRGSSSGCLAVISRTSVAGKITSFVLSIPTVRPRCGGASFDLLDRLICSPSRWILMSIPTLQ